MQLNHHIRICYIDYSFNYDSVKIVCTKDISNSIISFKNLATGKDKKREFESQAVVKDTQIPIDENDFVEKHRIFRSRFSREKIIKPNGNRLRKEFPMNNKRQKLYWGLPATQLSDRPRKRLKRRLKNNNQKQLKQVQNSQRNFRGQARATKPPLIKCKDQRPNGTPIKKHDSSKSTPVMTKLAMSKQLLKYIGKEYRLKNKALNEEDDEGGFIQFIRNPWWWRNENDEH